MESVLVVYCNGEMISSFERVLFECPSGFKVVIINEDMSLDTLRKIITDAIRGNKILLNLFYR